MVRRERQEEEKPEWVSTQIEELAVANGKWLAQLVTAPDGNRSAGIRKIAILKSGREQFTSNGFNIPINDEAPKLLRQLSKMLKSLADAVETELEEE